jgi:SAM-dependent methyltransferase
MKDVSLVCPECSSFLSESEYALYCNSCNTKYPITNGIPRFISNPYYWGEIPQALMSEVNRKAKENGWFTSIEKIVAPDYPNIYRYITDFSRADFGYLMNLGLDKTVIDIGSGWGTLSTLIAPLVGKVLSVESVTERIEFTNIKANQEGLINVFPIQASFLQLPIPQAYADLAILNGVLEWIGIASYDDNPYNLQMSVLRRIFESLKTGGQLYIGIENRLGYQYFLGARDHSDLRFTSLMPRWLADLTMKWKNQQSRRSNQAAGSYRTFTYSYWGYRSILRKAGFSHVRMYLVFPDYNRPSYLIPADNHLAFNYLIEQMYSSNNFKRRILKSLARNTSFIGLQKIFSPCFSIIATK